MKLGVAMTVGNRLDYLSQALQSWSCVRGTGITPFLFRVERTPEQNTAIELISRWANRCSIQTYIVVNHDRFGGQENPFYAMTELFNLGVDYGILAEDDLLVSDDILEYHRWAAEAMGDHEKVLMACSYTEEKYGAPAAVYVRPGFANVWIWGTWAYLWNSVIAPNWDHGYQHGDGYEKGWDWHLNLRVMPERELTSLQPGVSRVQNIGRYGTHSSEVSFTQASNWQQFRDPVRWSLRS